MFIVLVNYFFLPAYNTFETILITIVLFALYLPFFFLPAYGTLETILITISGCLFNQEGGNDESATSDDDPELDRRLEKQRKRAIAAAHGARRSHASRNSSKDKGGRRSYNAKMQMKSLLW